MKSSKAIGGYFDLEVRRGTSCYPSAVALNSARNAFEYILRASAPSKVYMPKFTCDVMLEPLEKTKTAYVFYELDENLEIKGGIAPEDDEFVVYTNYFGIKDKYCHALARQLESKLIVDCSQAFYYVPVGEEQVFYSPRKFIGVADGAYLITQTKLSEDLPRDTSYQRMDHLLKRVDLGAEAGYGDFKKNDDSLIGQPIKTMSLLTEKILDSLDYESIKETRHRNFQLLHQKLESSNLLKINDTFAAPMVYPFRVHDASQLKEKLIKNRIFVPTYWPNVFTWCTEGETEYQLARDIVPLPIDQRYNEDDMQRILEVIS